MSLRVALLINFVAPYRLALFKAVRSELDEFRIFVSTPMEPDRPWYPDWADLDVVVQNSLTLPTRRRRHGFDQRLFIHFPYDTLVRLVRYDPDVVVSGEFGLRSLQASLYRRLRPRSRLIIWATLSEHTENAWGAVRIALRRFILRSADAVITNGGSGARYIASLGVSVPVFIMNQPIDVPRFSVLPLERTPGTTRRLIFSGRLIGQKGVLEFQRVVATWAQQRPEFKVEIVWLGDGELRDALQSAPVSENLVQQFLGYVSYDALPAVYGSCGALVLPSFFDEWGLVVNEAMASGLPVLGSVYSQAVEEMVSEGRTGWRFDPRQPESIAFALDKLFSVSDEDLLTMRRAARSRAALITPERAAASMLAAIHAVNSPIAKAVTTRGVEYADGGNLSSDAACRTAEPPAHPLSQRVAMPARRPADPRPRGPRN
jgi:glycosyltransferase involved in cell wall biosynthesis